MADSKNDGFAVLDKDTLECKVRYAGNEMIWKKGEKTGLSDGLMRLIEIVAGDYAYLLG